MIKIYYMPSHTYEHLYHIHTGNGYYSSHSQNRPPLHTCRKADACHAVEDNTEGRCLRTIHLHDRVPSLMTSGCILTGYKDVMVGRVGGVIKMAISSI